MIARMGEETMLKAETRGTFFTKGGELVEFFINGKSIGKRLSGGDGFAYKPFKPLRPGLYRMLVRSGKEEGKGLLLSLRKGERILFIDVEGGLFKDGFMPKPRQGAKETIKKLGARFPIVLLQTEKLGLKSIQVWLKENGFTDFPVTPWEQGMIFDEIKAKGFKIKAVVGGASVIESARSFKAKLFSFDEVEGAEEVKNWQEIGKKLR